MKEPTMTDKDREQIEWIAKKLTGIKPEHVAASDDFKKWFAEKAQQTILDQYLSELQRNDQAAPRILGFMDDGSMGTINLSDAFDGEWGDQRSKDMTAKVHEIATRAPGTLCACFVSETWMVQSTNEEDYNKQWRGKNLKDHPERKEAITISALKYDWNTNHLMQLFVMAEVLKIFAEPRRPRHYRETKLGEIKVIDPVGGKDVFKGRFVPSDNKEAEDGNSG